MAKDPTINELMEWWAEHWDGQPSCAGDSCAQAFYEEILVLREQVKKLHRDQFWGYQRSLGE